MPDRPVVWLHGEVKSPPFSAEARIEAGVLLRRIQGGDRLALPHSRPMPAIGRRCHELRIVDHGGDWRIVYRTDAHAVVIVAVFYKKTKVTPKRIIQMARRRLVIYDTAVKEER